MDLVDGGWSPERVSALFGVGRNVVRDWMRLREETGSLEKRALNRSERKINAAAFEQYTAEHPLALNAEVGEHFGVTESAVRYWQRKLGITRKKVVTTYEEGDLAAQEEFAEQVEEVPKQHRVYVDESGFEEFYSRRIGHSRRGKKICQGERAKICED